MPIIDTKEILRSVSAASIIFFTISVARRMKKLPAFIAGFLLASVIFLLALLSQIRLRHEAETNARLAFAGQMVRIAIEQKERDIAERLAAFAEATKSDQMFSLRLLAENNPTAPEVNARASKFLGPMGFSFLDITDSAGTILSSGRFPASAGNSIARKMTQLSGEPRFMEDNLMGVAVPTLQAEALFKVADCITFHALGGIVIDSALLSRLSPCEGVTVFLRYDTTTMGLPNVQKISDVRNRRIMINDKEYPAVQLPFSTVDGKAEPILIVVLMKENQR